MANGNVVIDRLQLRNAGIESFEHQASGDHRKHMQTMKISRETERHCITSCGPCCVHPLCVTTHCEIQRPVSAFAPRNRRQNNSNWAGDGSRWQLLCNTLLK